MSFIPLGQAARELIHHVDVEGHLFDPDKKQFVPACCTRLFTYDETPHTVLLSKMAGKKDNFIYLISFSLILGDGRTKPPEDGYKMARVFFPNDKIVDCRYGVLNNCTIFTIDKPRT